MSDQYDEDDRIDAEFQDETEWDEDDLDEAIDACGRLPDDLSGGCMKAGSEYCDFKCPFRIIQP